MTLETAFDLPFWFEFAATVTGGLSGGMSAVRARYDIFGTVAIACITGMGGGIIRDILLQNYGLYAFQSPWFLLSCALAGVAVFYFGKLATYLEYFVKIHGFSAEVKQGIYSSDSIPFADSGIPGVNFTRFGAPGAAYIHNRFDTLDFLSADALAKTTRTVLAFAQEMANAAVLPVERKIPQNMVDEVEKYLYKKELAEAGGCSR